MSKEEHRKRQDRKDEFISSLVEFQKAQCYFVIAVQIASMVLMHNIQQTSEENMVVIPITAAIGVQAPIFTYLAVAKYGRQSSYLLSLTVATWILVTAVMWTAYRIIFINQSILYETNLVPTCGNQDLSGFCGTFGFDSFGHTAALQSDIYAWFNLWIVIWVLSIFLLCSAIGQWFQLTKFPRVRSKVESLDPHGKIGRYMRVPRYVGARFCQYLDPDHGKDQWIFYSILGLFSSSLCVELYQLVYICTLNLEDSGNWSFGQIVAVLVWAAPLGEFLNLSISMSPPQPQRSIKDY